MCGIAGIIEKDPQQARAVLDRMVAAQTHRGPDAAGAETCAFGRTSLGLGHRRLSILDLSPLGHQPMTHAATGCKIVFNGEIYNFRRLRAELEAQGDVFCSGSDTEVLLAGIARHGPDFIKRLEGMYAFGFFDPRGPVLLLARDPAGIKPLYVARSSESFVFASEVRAILASGLVPRTISKAGLAGLLAYGAVQQPLTLFESVTMLPPGAWQVIESSADGFRACPPQIWWQPPAPDFTQPVAEIVVRTARFWTRRFATTSSATSRSEFSCPQGSTVRRSPALQQRTAARSLRSPSGLPNMRTSTNCRSPQKRPGGLACGIRRSAFLIMPPKRPPTSGWRPPISRRWMG